VAERSKAGGLRPPSRKGAQVRMSLLEKGSSQKLQATRRKSCPQRLLYPQNKINYAYQFKSCNPRSPCHLLSQLLFCETNKSDGLRENFEN